MGEEVKVLGTWASPFSNRVELALKLKGIPYQYIEEDLSNKSPLLLKSNPIFKKIPVLIHNGTPISESLLILEYIDETWPNIPILPNNPSQKATARFWAQFVDGKILGTASKYRSAKLEEKEQIIEQVGDEMRVLEKELKGKKYFGGESIGYVDIAAFFILNMFLIREQVMEIGLISKQKFPVILEWMENMKEIDVVKQCLPPKDKHLAYITAMVASSK
ncbi:glutathione S-transferase U7-like [Euphorbia lathyris]|uniref:glutathione S-transferase U7-like n=1 Tax=Euphorbia lathyris TaxID=212925 RepID=UPI0033138984